MSNKFSFIFDKTINHKNNDLESVVERKINNYMKFISCDELLCEASTWVDACIFGGAVRDSIANLEIHDIDILTLPIACRTIKQRLLNHNFKIIDKTTIDLASIYEGSLINEPITFHRDNVFIQLIRPRCNSFADESPKFQIKEWLQKFVSEVDLSCCGVSYFYNTGLTENYPEAINHCKHKVFSRIKNNDLYNEKRIESRVHKLMSRGWKEIENKIDKSLTINVEDTFKYMKI
jgi:hypothetical protein